MKALNMLGAQVWHFPRSWRMIGSVVLLGTIVGCGGGPPPPKLVVVKGVVTDGGKPLSEANVEFIPTKERPSYATTNASGEFELLYEPGKPGVVLGNHTVRITEKFQGGSAEDGAPPPPAKPPAEPRSFTIQQPVAISESTKSITIDVKAGTATPQS